MAVGAAVLAAVAAATPWDSLVSTSSPEPPALVRPNIVVVLTDDQSLESVARMPHVFARSDWVAFDNAFVNVALCCPSRASVLTGQYSHHTRVERNTDGMRLDDGHTVATWLRDGGYRTALLGKYLNQYPWGRAGYLPPGWDEWHVFEDVGYFDYSLNQNGRTVRRGSSARDYSTDVLARKAVKFISRQQGPFFLVVAPNAPHGPRTAPPRHRGIFADARLERPGSFNEADVSDKPAWVRALPPRDAGPTENLRRKQYRSLLAVDDLVRDVFSALDDRRLLDTTVVMFLSDNGYSFGEHRHVGKICPYEECLRIPLLVRYPGRDGTRISDLVQNVDVAATIAELAGVRPTIAQDGLSLLPLLRGRSPSWRSAVLLRWAGYAGSPPDPDTGPDIPGFWGIRTARYKYIELDTGETELYDLHADPGELANRSREPSSRRLIADLGRQLASLRQG
ncbi:MAG: sulfatase family protein [Acidimicrobiales bacterium]